MINLKEGLSFQQYLEKNTPEQKEAILKAYENTEFSEESKKFIQNIDKPLNLVVYSEGYCPDCVVTLPFVRKIEELNTNIKASIFPRVGNEEILEEMIGTARIPTVLCFTENMEPKGAYIEVPEDVKEMMIGLSPEKQKEIVMEYRAGKFNNYIEKNLVNILK